MTVSTALAARQLWGPPIETSSSSITAPHCTPFTLPASGVLALASTTITLSSEAVYIPQCTGDDFATSSDDSISAYESLRAPFYASVTPQVFVIAATTVIAWILVVMLVITPRTGFYGASAAQPGFVQGHGIIGGAHGGTTSLIGVGSRPWLQKAAALTVAISLTIATADTFLVAQKQYSAGYMDASAMREQVIGSLEIRISRVISDVFVWLAQVQTLIRLFPRHKEKVLIKWIGFCLIICDTTFSSLNAFATRDRSASRYFVDAIPAFSYVFELALGLLYAAWVMYYSLTKRRYAFWSAKMKSVSLIALLSFVAVLTPVVFFITDISNRDIASWGDYFRWVGAAAASVVVWEWVERIEAIERDEKKDGILGRELFDDDDGFDDIPDGDIVWASGRRGHGSSKKHHHHSRTLEDGVLTSEKQNSNSSDAQDGPPSQGRTSALARHSRHLEVSGIERPQPVASPISRTETSSAGSTVYIVRAEPAAGVPQPIRRRPDATRRVSQNSMRRQSRRISGVLDAEKAAALAEHEDVVREEAEQSQNRPQDKWYTVANPFKRKRASPPAEVQKAQRAALSANDIARSATPKHNFSRWDIRNRFGVLAGDAGDMFWSRVGRTDSDRHESHSDDVIVIPAQPRGSGRTWSPAVLDTQTSSSQHQETGSSHTQNHGSDSDAAAAQSADLSGSTAAAGVAVRDFDVSRATSPAAPEVQPIVRQTPPRQEELTTARTSATDPNSVSASRRSPTSGDS